MLQKSYIIALTVIAWFWGIHSFFIYQEYSSSAIILFLIATLVVLIFNYMHSFMITGKFEATFTPNLGFPLILLTNPFLHFLFVIITEIFLSLLDKSAPKHRRLWEYLYNTSFFIILNNLVYFTFYSILPDKPEFNIKYIITILLLFACISILSKLSILFALFLDKNLPDTIEIFQFFVFQTIRVTLLATPTYMFIVYFYKQEAYLIVFVTIFMYIFMSKVMQETNEKLRKEAELEAYKEIALKDPLTGSFNRRFLKQRLTELKASRTKIAIVVTDIDNFKHFNDTYNHDIGDQVIEWFVKRLTQEVKKTDNVIRSGGEEFILLISYENKADVIKMIEEIRSSVETIPIEVNFNKDQLLLSCTASFGLAFCEDTSKQNIDEILVKADNLLYNSKRTGKNKVSY